MIFKKKKKGIIPSTGISNEQLNRINDLKDIFPNNITWCLSNEMHIETFDFPIHPLF